MTSVQAAPLFRRFGYANWAIAQFQPKLLSFGIFTIKYAIKSLLLRQYLKKPLFSCTDYKSSVRNTASIFYPKTVYSFFCFPRVPARKLNNIL